MRLDGKTALITGGGSGIGYAIASAFVESGASVWICDVDSATVQAINNSGVGITGILADAGLQSDVQGLFELLFSDTGHQLDVLINNAGVAGPNGPLETIELQDWNETMRVNLQSAFLCCRQALPVMKEQRNGSIVNLSSTAGTYGFPLRTPYASAKWGIVGLTKSLAMEVGEFGIRVNAICPGSVSGPRMDQVIEAEARSRKMTPEKIREQFVRQVSLKCFVDVHDIAQMALFVCSDAGRKISGQTLHVDGHTESLSHFEQ